MYLFKAKAAAIAELERVCKEQGVTLEQVRAYLDGHPSIGSGLHKPPHRAAGSAADVVMEVAPLLKTTRWQRTRKTALDVMESTRATLRRSPGAIATAATRASDKAHEIAGWLREDLKTYRESRASA
jgi:hypothetical protein